MAGLAAIAQQAASTNGCRGRDLWHYSAGPAHGSLARQFANAYAVRLGGLVLEDDLAMQVTSNLNSKRTQILQIAASHGARDVRLFGSAARHDARFDSDVDLLVRLDPGRTLLDIVAIKQDLEDLLGTRVDVVTEAGISPYIREQILKEAVRL
jgi:predicted nucleotidyltransferase